MLLSAEFFIYFKKKAYHSKAYSFNIPENSKYFICNIHSCMQYYSNSFFLVEDFNNSSNLNNDSSLKRSIFKGNDIYFYNCYNKCINFVFKNKYRK
jgi:hypothetical protein